MQAKKATASESPAGTQPVLPGVFLPKKSARIRAAKPGLKMIR
jgi:hypothetical protein